MSYRKRQVKMIEEIDQCIDLLRQDWLDSNRPADKKAYMDRIDAMLDQRIVFMRNRDK